MHASGVCGFQNVEGAGAVLEQKAAGYIFGFKGRCSTVSTVEVTLSGGIEVGVAGHTLYK